MKLVNPKQLDLIVKTIANGGVVAFPSDTSYGLAADIANEIAILKLYKIKGRQKDKKISYIFKDVAQIKKWGFLSPYQEKILANNLPGPFTFIVTAKKPLNISGKSLGVRIPNFSFTYNLSQVLDNPYSATSANISQNPACYSSQEVFAEFKNRKYKPDLIVDFGTLIQNPASGVFDLRNDTPSCLRKGAKELILS